MCATKTDKLTLDPHSTLRGGRRESIATICPLIFTYMLQQTCMLMCTCRHKCTKPNCSFFLSNQFKFHTKTNARVNKIKDAKKEYFDNDQKNKDKCPKKRLNDCDCKWRSTEPLGMWNKKWLKCKRRRSHIYT